ncbi:hypothetical protein CHS0354_032993, partial [Potamilus streckersoni]
ISQPKKTKENYNHPRQSERRKQRKITTIQDSQNEENKGKLQPSKTVRTKKTKEITTIQDSQNEENKGNYNHPIQSERNITED